MKKVNCILLVDDNPNENYFHTYIIREANVCNQLKTVYDGEEALEYLRQTVKGEEENPIPDLIFLDINMPRKNGFDFLNEFKLLEVSNKQNIVIIMLSTSDNPDDIKRAMQTKEVKEFIAKPLDFDILNAIIQRYF
jgi:CheY-like chemotaxis protein